AIHYGSVDVVLERAARTATLTVKAPAVEGGSSGTRQMSVEQAISEGAAWWPLQMARELDDAILSLRTNELELGTWLLKTRGNVDHVLAADAALQKNRSHWFVREV